MAQILIFKADSMAYTPFVRQKDIDFLNNQGIEITDNEAEGEIFVAQNIKKLIPFQIKYGSKKKYLIWTAEPRWDTHFQKKVKLFLGMPHTHIMNVYTGDIFLNNYSTLNSSSKFKNIDRVLEPLDEVSFPDFRHKKIVALMVYRNNKWKWSLKKEGRELDLCYLRTKIALEGYKLNKVDIYGKGWPNSISLEDSRGKGWQARKPTILQNYHFNLCFENTNIDYYCSEKLWDSIKYGCLPIYYGQNNKIYEDFPRNSFLDYCDFKNSSELFDYVEAMDIKEYRNRMNICINVYNQIHEKLKELNEQPYEEVLMRIVQKAKEIIDTP